MPVPKSWSQKKKNNLPFATSRPDLSNYIKFIEDALNGHLWMDDALIVKLIAKKHYSEHPQTIVKVKVCKGDPCQ